MLLLLVVVLLLLVRGGSETEVQETEHVVWQLTAVVRQGVGGWRVVADQRVHEEAARHLVYEKKKTNEQKQKHTSHDTG